jgi:NAD(P)-dependent dehydrogenase (short-subunit alcohol dehydrogenase family)
MGEKVCVLVGVSKGLGLSLARLFGSKGYRMALLDRRVSALETYPQTLARDGIEARSFAADASRPGSLARAIHTCRQDLGAPEVLVHTAGPMRRARALGLTPRQILYDMRVHVVGALTCAQAVVAHMRERGGGSILFAGDGRAAHPEPDHASVGIGKAALRNMTMCLAEELEPEGIHVGLVTVHGQIRAGTRLDPGRVAQQFWSLHRQKAGTWKREHHVR